MSTINLTKATKEIKEWQSMELGDLAPESAKPKTDRVVKRRKTAI